MTSKIPANTSAFLALVAGAALFAAPTLAQEAEEGTGSAPDAAQAPDTAGQEPEAAAGDAAEEAAGDAAERQEPQESGDEPAEGSTAGATEGSAADAETGAAGAESADEGGPLIVEAEEGSVFDDQTFEGEDDDFTPSEEIPVDKPIPFPVDI